MRGSRNGTPNNAETRWQCILSSAATNHQWRLGCFVLLFSAVVACPNITNTSTSYSCSNSSSYPLDIGTPFPLLTDITFRFMNAYPNLTAQPNLASATFGDINANIFPANILPISIRTVVLSGLQLSGIASNAFDLPDALTVAIRRTNITSLPTNLFYNNYAVLILDSNPFTSFPANAFRGFIQQLEIGFPLFTCIPPDTVRYNTLLITNSTTNTYNSIFNEFICGASCSVPTQLCPNMVSNTSCLRLCPPNTVSTQPFTCLNGIRTEAAQCNSPSCTVQRVENSMPDQCVNIPSGTACSVKCNAGYTVYGYEYTCALGILAGSEICANSSSVPSFLAVEIPSVGLSDFRSSVSMTMINRKMYVHRNNAPLFLKQPGMFMRICLVFGWAYGVSTFEHSPKCAAITADCRCYNWINTQSGTPCIDMLLNETITLQWYLQPAPDVRALPRRAILQYNILKARWPHYSVHSFAEAHCALAPHYLRPANIMVSHTIPVTTLVPSIDLPGIETVIWMSLFAYGVTAAFVYLTSQDKSEK